MQPWNVNEREHRCSSLLTVPVAVAVTSIKHTSVIWKCAALQPVVMLDVVATAARVRGLHE